MTDRAVPEPAPPQDLTSAILRYEPGAERFQFSFTFKGKKFNFDRSATENTSTFLERVKANLGKKMKKEDPSIPVKIISEAEEHVAGSPAEEKCPFNTILDKYFQVQAQGCSSASILKLGVGTEVVEIDVNPPEVLKIKFLKQAYIGFPILPIKLEGSPSFQREGSKFIWEYRAEEPKNEGVGL